jgi:hypothetical protein
VTKEMEKKRKRTRKNDRKRIEKIGQTHKQK